MKFRTEITPTPLIARIDYGSEVLSLGSCFADEIAARLRRAKFRVTTSPLGILFNPASIAAALTRFAECRLPKPEEIVTHGDGMWFSFDAHTSLNRPSKQEAEDALREATEYGALALQRADFVILTFGTAWIYTHNTTGQVVANCHKVPQSHFTRRRLSVEEIVAMYKPLFEGVLRNKQVILTVSPVRHLGDGAEQNAVSKATLRLAVDALCAEWNNAHYFPAYELLTDDLRDYRFYADDMVHPATKAVEYIWEKFSTTALSAQTQEQMARVLRIVTAAEHRPQNPHSTEYAEFCRRNIKAIGELPMVDFSEERAFFEQYFSKS
jgi:hypothetical protein